MEFESVKWHDWLFFFFFILFYEGHYFVGWDFGVSIFGTVHLCKYHNDWLNFVL